MKHNQRRDQLLVVRMMSDDVGRANVTTDEERVLKGRCVILGLAVYWYGW